MELEARLPVVVESALLQQEEEPKPNIESLLPHRTLAETTPSFESAGVEDSVVAEGPVEARAAVKAEAEEVEEEDTDTEMIVVPARRTAAIVLSETEEEENVAELPSATAKPAPTANTIGLPLPGARFATKDDFIEVCRAASVASTGFTMYKCYNDSAYILLTCSHRLSADKCRARCAARRSADGDWTVHDRSYVLEHTHAESATIIKQRPRSSTDSELSDSPSTDERSDEESEEEAPTLRQTSKADFAAYQAAFPGVCPVIPRLPQPGDSFPRPEAVLLAARSKMVPITGTSLRKEQSSRTRARISCHHTAPRNPWQSTSTCAFAIICVRHDDGRWTVDRESCYQHAHGRDRRIVQDSSWRPAISGSRQYNEKEERKKLQQLLAQARASPASSSSRRAKFRVKPSPPPPSKRPRSSLGPGTPPPSSHPQRESKPNLPSYPRPRHSLPARLPSTSVPVSRSPAPPTSAPSPSLYLPALTTFLTSIHPSLSLSAQLLYEGGLKDPSLLLAFLALEDSTREAFLLEANVALLQRHLLKAKIGKAREGGWLTSS